LREVARTSPYMHDGSLATLEDVVKFYDEGGRPNPTIDPEIRPAQAHCRAEAGTGRLSEISFGKAGHAHPPSPNLHKTLTFASPGR
jgi:cytochrome c peroxidase